MGSAAWVLCLLSCSVVCCLCPGEECPSRAHSCLVLVLSCLAPITPVHGGINMNDFTGVLGTVALIVGIVVLWLRLPTITLFGGEQ